MKTALITFFFSLSFSLWANDWAINSQHSELHFSIDFLKVSKVSGNFLSFKGGLKKEQNILRNIVVEIDSRSIFTNNKIRDGHLRESDFLFSKDYPSIFFKISTPLTLLEGKGQVVGTLYFKDKQLDIPVDIDISSILEDSWGHPTFFVKIETALSRKKLGLEWNKTLSGENLLLGNSIKVWGSFQFQKANEQTPAYKYKIPDTAYMRKREKVKRGETIILSEKKPPLSLEGATKTSSSALKKVKKKTPPPPSICPKNSTPEKEKGFVHQISILYLGLLGFLASFYFFIETKRFMARTLSAKNISYQELGFWGILGDIIGVGIVFLYAYAYYHVFTY